MGKEIVYCEICGDRILEQEFEKGKAVTILNKNYCVKCKAEAVKGISAEDLAEESGPKKGRSSAVMRAVPSKTPPRHTSVRPATPPRTPLPATARPQGATPHRQPAVAPAHGSRLPIFLGAGVGVVAILVLVIVVLSGRKSSPDGGGSGPGPTTEDKAAKAEQAWKDLQTEIESASKNDEVDRVLAKIEVVRSALAGSKYAAQLDPLKEEWQKKKRVNELLEEARRAAEADKDFTQFPEVAAKFEAARQEARVSAKGRMPFIEEAWNKYAGPYEREAEKFYDELKDEVRDSMSRRKWDFAMKILDSEARFPRKFRHSKVWKGTLERWYKECEARKAEK